jgi:hypothetical protein
MHYRRNERNTALPDHVVRIVVHRPSVELGIPMAPRNRNQNWEYPYGDMDVGDSFHVMFSETSNPIVASRISVYNKRHPDTRFSCRIQSNVDGEKLTRIWRIR